MNLNKITLFDTSIATANLGDEIIVDGVRSQLFNKFQDNTMFFNIPTHERIGRQSYKLLKQSKYSFVAGTNLLSSNHYLLRSKSWKLNFMDLNFITGVPIILVGVGWGAYQGTPNYLAKRLYNKLLSKDYIHSVRDSYTEEKLKSIGIDNVINTGCATMWELTPDHCSMIPKDKSSKVVFTLTDYDKDEYADQKLINYLEELYEEVYFWPQGSKDYDYINNLDHTKINFINPTLEAYDNFLKSNENVDYVGTRLHGGIRALQYQHRTLIIGIDNRALEKQKDFNLNVLDRKKIDNLPDVINTSFETEIKLDIAKINAWKNQFNDL